MDSLLQSVTEAMTARGHGIMSVDESPPTIARRFAEIGIESTAETRRAYRELLFSAPRLGDFIAAATLGEETLHQLTGEGVPFAEMLDRQGIVPGVRADRGSVPLAGFPDEVITEGLDGLRSRLTTYRQAGARFVKWRAVLRIGAEIPTRTCIEANAHALARCAALCQEADLVPMVEPEVLMAGDHSLTRCESVTGKVLNAVFAQLLAHRVRLENVILKPNMVLAGSQRRIRPQPYAVAEATVRCIEGHVPAAIPGIAFGSGGQPEEDAVRLLDLVNRVARGPWQLTFSFGRVLHGTALLAWAGRNENREAAQRALLARARAAALACQGRYDPSVQRAG